MKVDEFDAVECNEAFAAIALMWQKEFDYPMERFNPRGGAIALGHPLGASGVALMTRLLRHLETPAADRLPNHVRRRRPSQRNGDRTLVTRGSASVARPLVVWPPEVWLSDQWSRTRSSDLAEHGGPIGRDIVPRHRQIRQPDAQIRRHRVRSR